MQATGIKLLQAISLSLIIPFKPSSDITLVASTPGDEQIKSLLAISAETKVDFIRWNLIKPITANERQIIGIFNPILSGFWIAKNSIE